MLENLILHVIFYAPRHDDDSLPDEKQEKPSKQGHDKNQYAKYQNELKEIFPGYFSQASFGQWSEKRKTFHHIIYGYSDQLRRNDYEDVGDHSK